MRLRRMVRGGMCLLVAGYMLTQPVRAATPPLASGCDVRIQGESLSLDESCIRRTPALRQALVDMAVYLRTTDASRLASPSYHGPLDKTKMIRTVEQLITWLDRPAESASPIGKQFDFYALGDPQEKRPVQYGGYFTPVLNVSNTRTAEYRFPVYARPKGDAPLPSRRDIMSGALQGKGLEIAWADNLVDYYFMQVQGSGLIRYPDGRTQLLGFAGKNSQPYTSIGRYMQEKGYLRTDNLSNNAIRQWLRLNPDKLDEVINANQSFVFFRPIKDGLRSASSLPVVAGHTASVDTTMIPFGSVLLAELPIRDKDGKIVQHEWRLLLATDRRTDDRGAVRIGIYTGEGEEGWAQAQRFYPAGRAFLLQSGS
ncbi:MAG TPA: MltA domain-containing protein [Candidatus Thiothrix moscowensis]|uniref:MltA domain-containing protein n=1 Tax=unclassified Thiothrix TaxID=2636184 RepID=UPI0025FC126D|nr:MULTISPECIES: MltA domain-containing protein [unclassified Thiothrix]HRJ51325.1 MltA domain-containing protein [Candidatus Thiothrix moscowensis]HRJ91620.1 MltA domain-containing protein [Candidatus Thiothrix moscowensis]